MIVTDYISKDFKPPRLDQTVEQALRLINEYSLTHVPVIEGLTFAGNFSRETLEEHDPKTLLRDLRAYIDMFYITANATLLDATQNFHNEDTNVLAVLDIEMHYVGMLMMDDLISAISAMPFISEPGATMVVEIAQKQFSISEIAKICESNNARIIGLFVTAYHHDQVQVSIKLISENLVSVIETFERFGYNVVFKFFEDEKQDLLKGRFDQLMKYLDI